MNQVEISTNKNKENNKKKVSPLTENVGPSLNNLKINNDKINGQNSSETKKMGILRTESLVI